MLDNKDNLINRSVPYRGLVKFLNGKGTTQLANLLGRGVVSHTQNLWNC